MLKNVWSSSNMNVIISQTLTIDSQFERFFNYFLMSMSPLSTLCKVFFSTKEVWYVRGYVPLHRYIQNSIIACMLSSLCMHVHANQFEPKIIDRVPL